MNHTIHLKKQLRCIYLSNFFSGLRITDAVWVALLAARGFSLWEIGLAESVYHIVSLLCEVPSYLPMLGDVLEQFRQQYPGIPLETVSLSNDAVCAQLQDGTLDAGLVMDLGGCAAGLTRTALTRHTAALLVPRCSPFWGRSSIAPAELDGQLLLVPGFAPEPLAPLWQALVEAGAHPKLEIGEKYYQVLYRTQERNGLALDRLEITSDHSMDNVQDVALDGMPPICAAFLQPEHAEHPCVRLLCSFLQEHLRNL